jgi:cytochrome P450
LREQQPVAWVAPLRLWLVTRWDDVMALESTDDFAAEMPDSPLTRTIGANMLHSDGAGHLRLRDAVAPTLRPATLRGWVERVVPDIAADLLWATSAAGGAVDLMCDYAEPLAVRAITELIGLPPVPYARLRAWCVAIGQGAANFASSAPVQAVADEACDDLDRTLAPMLAGEAAATPGSLLSGLIDQADALALSNAEILGIVKLMIIGGMQESRDLIGTALQVLLEQPAVLARVRADERLVARLLEECLRWSSPVGTVTRVATRPTVLHGISIPKGAMVGGVLASANRDSRRWRDPDRFDLDRDEGPHASFGRGAHSCVGAGLSRLLGKVAVEAVLAAAPRLVAAGVVEQRGWEFRGPVTLPATLAG